MTDVQKPQGTNLEQSIGGHDKDVFIQVWRGIAALLVIYYHFVDRVPYTVMGSDRPPILPYYSGKLGVLVFFVISGYLITQSLLVSRNLASFYAKRVSRIWPLFIVASITVYVFLQFFDPPVVEEGARQFYTQERTLVDLFGTIFFLEDLGFVWVDGVFWSILVELKFYMWIGLLAWLSPKRFIAWFGSASVLLAGLEMVLHLADSPAARLLNGIFIAQYLPFFAVGAILVSGKHRELLTLNLIMALVQSGLKIASNPNFELVGTTIFALALIAFLAVDAAVLGSRIFMTIGDYSYSWYLFHQLVGLSLIRAVAPSVGIDWAVAMALVFTFVLSVVGSWAAEWRFRRPFYNVLFLGFSLLRLDRARLGEADSAQAAPSGALGPSARVSK